MIVVIQCAARKRHDAGFMRMKDGRRVCFVADPAQAPADGSVYARPDDPSDIGPTWRELLRRYNETSEDNPLALVPASTLYLHDVYQPLATHVGIANFYILSAGWGLIGGSFLTPHYDITFTAQADGYKRRRRADRYRDFCMLPAATTDPIVFFGSKEYLPLFASLTAGVRAPKTVFYRSQTEPDLPGISAVRFDTRRRTNWHYECANAFLDGAMDVPFDPLP